MDNGRGDSLHCQLDRPSCYTNRQGRLAAQAETPPRLDNAEKLKQGTISGALL